MTYLQLINSVLRKLREDEVTTSAESDYSKLIGDFINDALSNVEAAWDWSILRSTDTLTTEANTSTYSLTDFGIRSEIMSIYDTSNGSELKRRHKEWILKNKYQTQSTGNPRYYALNGTDANGDIEIIVHPTPDSAKDYAINVVKRNESLVNDTDTTKLPKLPIIQLAFAYALRERGETGGQSASEQIMIAQKDLSDAIGLDGANQTDELIFGVI